MSISLKPMIVMTVMTALTRTGMAQDGSQPRPVNTTIGIIGKPEAALTPTKSDITPNRLGETWFEWLKFNQIDLSSICGKHKRNDTRMDFKTVCNKLSSIRDTGHGDFYTIDQNGRSLGWRFVDGTITEYYLNAKWHGVEPFNDVVAERTKAAPLPLAQSVELADAATSPWEQIRIGQTIAEVHRILGEPKFVTEGDNHFEVWPGDFSLSMLKGRVELILNPKLRRQSSTDAKVENETCFLPVLFAKGGTLVIELQNGEETSHDLLIQRFSASGTVVDSIVRTATGRDTTQIRMDMSAENVGYASGSEPRHVVWGVLPGDSSAKAGLRNGDLLLRVDGQPLKAHAFLASGDKAAELTYERDSVRYETKIVPPSSPSIGSSWWTTNLHSETDNDTSTGWVRVVEEGKAVNVTAIYEYLVDNKLMTYALSGRHPALDIERQLDNSIDPDFCNSQKGTFICDGSHSVYFVNVSDAPIRVGVCQDNLSGCTPILSETVNPRAMISYPIQLQKRYVTLKSTSGYAAVGDVWNGVGLTKTFNSKSSISFDPVK